MNAQEFLSEDGHAILLLCSALGAGEEQPFTLSEWNQLARKIQSSSLGSPSALLGRSATELADLLSIVPNEGERIEQLLGRSGRVALELESLFSRGMWVVTRTDEHYPSRLRSTLKHQAPTVLFGAGDIGLLGQGGIAVVGSRDIDEAGTAFAQLTGQKSASAKKPIVSGGARGTDRLAMQAALDAGGRAFGALADSLERIIRQPEVREFLLDERLVLITPNAPTVGFSVGAAMGRNKLIYGLADYAIVVSSDLKKGGTWAGAVEALKARWCPVFVRNAPSVPHGNRELIKRGAIPLDQEVLEAEDNLPTLLASRAAAQPKELELL